MNWTLLREVLSIIGDICLFGITAYTFRLTVLPKKLRFIGLKEFYRSFEGDSLAVTLENRSLAPVVVQSVLLLYADCYINIFENDESECIIEGFKTATITMKPYSEIRIHGEKVQIHDFKNLILRITTPRGVQYIAYNRGMRMRISLLICKIKDSKTKDYLMRQASVIRRSFNGTIIKDHVRYALIYKNASGDLQTVFIHQGGIMSASPFGYNALPKDIMDSKEDLQAYWENEFSKYNLPFRLVDLTNGNC